MKKALVGFAMVVAWLAWALLGEDQPRISRETPPELPKQVAKQPDAPREFIPTGEAYANLPTRLKVEVVNEAGETLPGVELEFRGRGGGERLRTDKHGWAYFSPDKPGMFGIHLHPAPPHPPYLAERRHIGSKQEFLRLTLRTTREVIIYCEINGIARLPDKFELEGPALANRKTDRRRGIIRGTILPTTDRVRFEIRAKGMVGGGAGAALDPGEPVHVRLLTRVPLQLRIEGDPEMAAAVTLQRDSFIPSWLPARGHVSYGHEDDTDDLTIREFEVGPGGYRAVLPGGIIVKQFEVAAGSGTVVQDIQLRKAEWLTFKPIFPMPRPKNELVSVRIAGRDVEREARVGIGKRIVHPCDRRLRFTLAGRGLAPHPVRGSAELDRGGELQLEAMDADGVRWVHFGWPATASGDIARGHRVYLLQPGDHAVHMRARLHYDSYRFAGELGNHDYAVTAPSFAPVLLRDVNAKTAKTDIGMLKPDHGATLRLQCKELKEGEVLLCIVYWAEVGIFLAHRSLHAGRRIAQLERMPGGTLRIELRARGKRWTQDVSSEGTGTIECQLQIPK